MEDIVIYDIETYPAQVKVDDKIIDINRMSVAVTFDYETQYQVWFEGDIKKLILYLLKFKIIIGFNSKHFDNAILNQYLNGAKSDLDEKSLDLMEIVENRLGHRVSLNNIAVPTLKLEKSGDGKKAIDWWLNGEKDKVVEYCKDDVRITKEIYEYGLTNKEIYYNSFGEIKKLKIDWSQEQKFKNVDFVYTLTDVETGKEIELDKENQEFFYALELAKTTNRIIYLTGKAGTGKTTFLKYLKKEIDKNTIVVAFTGVAAVNAGGQTIHSLFQIDPYEPPFLPNDDRLRYKSNNGANEEVTIFNHFKYNKAKRELLKSLELLIIDEVSMLRADFVDVIDKILRAFSGRNRNLPFGGIQVILIGDTFQLPPIEGDQWDILNKFYKSPFFFSSNVFQDNPPIYIELKKIYRQNEIEFINILNRIRINTPIAEDFFVLNRNIQPISNSLFDQNYIVLCSVNTQVNQINSSRLISIQGDEYIYEGEITGIFPKSSRITEVSLKLKVGSQIMFLRNGNNYYNGKIGKIEELKENAIICSTINNHGETIKFPIEKSIWHNVKYTYIKEKNKIEQEIIGSFTQYPIKLAWAITVHKSQGLTFEKVIININNFAPSGLVYVALSRCTSLSGLILANPIPRHCIKTDSRVIEFAKNITPDTLIVDMISQGKADNLYLQSRESLKKGNFDDAFSFFLKAIKYRNDIETKEFKKFFENLFKKYILLKNQFAKNSDLINELFDKIALLENKLEINNEEKLIIENEKEDLKNDAKKMSNLINIEKKEKNNLIKKIEEIQREKEELNKTIQNCNKEITNYQNDISNLEKEIIFLNRSIDKEKQDKNKFIKTTRELRDEIKRIQNLKWYDKLIGKK